MPVPVTCPGCRASLRVPDVPPGRAIQCPQCGKRFMQQPIADVLPAEDDDQLPWAVQASPRPAAAPPARRPSAAPAARRPAPVREQRSLLLPVLLIGGLAAGLLLILGVVGAGATWWLLARHDAPSDSAVLQVAAAADPAPPHEQVPPAPAGPAKAPREAPQPVQAPPRQPGPPAAPPPQPGNGDTIPLDTLNAIKKATVFIKAASQIGEGNGSGFLLQVEGQTGYVVTNHHVIAPHIAEVTRPPVMHGPFGPRFLLLPHRVAVRPTLTIAFDSGTLQERDAKADLVADDEEDDLAVLKVTGVKDLPRPIDTSQKAQLVETMPVYIFGFPLGRMLSTNKGNPNVNVGKASISSFRLDEHGELVYVQFEGEVNHGNSGGPVVDSRGRLVGVTVKKMPDTNIGLAIPPGIVDRLNRGRATSLTLARKQPSKDAVDLAGETWTIDLRHQIPATRSYTLHIAAPGQAPAPNDQAADVMIEARFFDPFGKVQSAAVRWLAAGALQGPPQARQGAWAPLSAAQQAELKIEEHVGTATVTFPAGGKDDTYYIQLSYRNDRGEEFCTQPRTFRLNRAAAAPAPGPVAQAPVDPPFKVDPKLTGTDNKVYLKDMQEFDVHKGPWEFGKGQMGNPEKSDIVVKGVRSPNGLGMHPPQSGSASAKYVLGKKARVFNTSVGFNDYNGFGPYPVYFTVLGDGKELARSRPVWGRGQTQTASLDVGGVDILELRVVCEGPNMGSHAVWIEPHLLKEGKPTEPAGFQTPPPAPGDPMVKNPEPKPPEPKPAEKKPLSDAELTQLLDDLKSTDFFKKNGAVERLKDAEVIAKRRKEVARALEPLLVPGENVFIRRNSGHALAVWGDADSVSVLLKYIGADEGDIFLKQIVVETLGALKDERAAEPVANCLNDFFLRGHAVKALKIMGSVAEKGVLKQLESADVGVRIEACKVLQEVGTKVSIPALETAAKDSNAGYAKAATDALQAIKERK